MAEYWSSSFFAFLLTEKKENMHLDLTSLVNKGFIIGPTRELLLA